MKIVAIEVGICATCAHHSEDRYDPSPAGISLSPGYMTDESCAKEDELAKEELGELDYENIGQDAEHQCPLWKLSKAIYFCKVHKQWVWGECSECMEKMFKEGG